MPRADSDTLTIFRCQRRRLVKTLETAEIVATDRADAECQMEKLLDSEWRVEALSSIDANEECALARKLGVLEGRHAALSEASLARACTVFALTLLFFEMMKKAF